MATKKLTKDERELLTKIAGNVKRYIFEKYKYKSLDAFSLEWHDLIAKPTLYQICDAKRDMKISTLSRLAKALKIDLEDLLK
jgi:hypothetical protein